MWAIRYAFGKYLKAFKEFFNFFCQIFIGKTNQLLESIYLNKYRANKLVNCGQNKAIIKCWFWKFYGNLKILWKLSFLKPLYM